VMFAANLVVTPYSTVVSLAVLTSTSNVFLIGELVLRTATNPQSFPCGSRSNSHAKLVLRKARILPTNAASAKT
jgi:hypothetical protein